MKGKRGQSDCNFRYILNSERHHNMKKTIFPVHQPITGRGFLAKNGPFSPSHCSLQAYSNTLPDEPDFFLVRNR